MTYSGFQKCSDYSGVVIKARELASSLTGVLRIRQDPPGSLVLHRVVGILPDGTEQKAPWAESVSFGTGFVVDGPPKITIEQRLIEYTIRSKDSLAMDVLKFLSEEPTFQGLFKAVEVIRWDLGGGSLTRGYKHIIDRKWITKELLDDFSYTANKVERHWDNLKPRARMDLQEARTLLGTVIEQWIAERANLQLFAPRHGKTL